MKEVNKDQIIELDELANVTGGKTFAEGWDCWFGSNAKEPEIVSLGGKLYKKCGAPICTTRCGCHDKNHCNHRMHLVDQEGNLLPEGYSNHVRKNQNKHNHYNA